MSTAEQRAKTGKVVVELLDLHRGLVMKTVVDVASELAPELDCCRALAQDSEIAMEVARRLDPVIVLPEPADTLVDGVIYLVGLGAAGCYRAATRRHLPARFKVGDTKIGPNATLYEHVDRFAKRYIPRLAKDAQTRLEAVQAAA